MNDSSQFNRNLTVIGLVVGALFPIVAIVLDLAIRDLSLRPSNVAIVFNVNKLQWVILATPLVFAGLFNYLGKLMLKREHYLNEKLQKEKEQFQVLEDIILNLDKRDFKVTTVHSDIDSETKRVINLIDTFKTKFHGDRDSESQRQWMMSGLNELSAILTSNDKIDKLSERTLQFLVKYTKTIQGSLFLYQEEGDDKFLELKSCYAYDRKKFMEKRFGIGEGVVGQCFLEKTKHIMYNIPPGYIKITSGLGESTPDCLVVIPLLSNDQVEGVIEIAGFHKLESFELEFLDKATEMMGNMLLTVKTNELTKVLLDDSQSQAEQMRAQEEEMRQNIEELAATEEEMVRKEQEYIRKISDLENRQTELERIDWEKKHRIESMQALLEQNNIEYSFIEKEKKVNHYKE